MSSRIDSPLTLPHWAAVQAESSHRRTAPRRAPPNRKPPLGYSVVRAQYPPGTANRHRKDPWRSSLNLSRNRSLSLESPRDRDRGGRTAISRRGFNHSLWLMSPCSRTTISIERRFTHDNLRSFTMISTYRIDTHILPDASPIPRPRPSSGVVRWNTIFVGGRRR